MYYHPCYHYYCYYYFIILLIMYYSYEYNVDWFLKSVVRIPRI